MKRIINNVLYDTQKSDFICSDSSYSDGFSPVKKRATYIHNYYIAGNGVIFCTYNGDIEFVNQEKTEEIKRRMKPKIYKKYFTLVIPGENIKKVKFNKKKFKNRLDSVE